MITLGLSASSWVIMLAALGRKSDKQEETYERLVKRLEQKLAVYNGNSCHPYWIGVAGGPGSGQY
jgi:hypothetical protein